GQACGTSDAERPPERQGITGRQEQQVADVEQQEGTGECASYKQHQGQQSETQNAAQPFTPALADQAAGVAQQAQRRTVGGLSQQHRQGQQAGYTPADADQRQYPAGDACQRVFKGANQGANSTGHQRPLQDSWQLGEGDGKTVENTDRIA